MQDLRGIEENFNRSPFYAEYICRKLILNLNLLHEAIVLSRSGHGNSCSRLCSTDGVSIETVTVHDGTVDASLDGYTTYRVYADMSSSTDFVSAVFGDAANPLSSAAQAPSTKAVESILTTQLR